LNLPLYTGIGGGRSFKMEGQEWGSWDRVIHWVPGANPLVGVWGEVPGS